MDVIGKQIKADILNAAYPITGLTYWGNQCYTVRRGGKLKGDYNYPKRGKITHMSNKSLARLILIAQTGNMSFGSMLTLTYPDYFTLDGSEVKRNLRVILTYLTRQKYTDNYLWFLEFQKRGAPHFHVLLDTEVILPYWRREVAWAWTRTIVSDAWINGQGWNVWDLTEGQLRQWNAEQAKVFAVAADPKTWELIRDKDGARKYVTKYATKAYQKTVPAAYQNVGRFWGSTRKVKPSPIWSVDTCEEDLRDWLDKNGHQAAAWDMIPGVLFNV